MADEKVQKHPPEVFCKKKKKSLLNKVASPRPAIKRDSDTGDFLWIFNFLKNTFFKEHLRTTASKG